MCVATGSFGLESFGLIKIKCLYGISWTVLHTAHSIAAVSMYHSELLCRRGESRACAPTEALLRQQATATAIILKTTCAEESTHEAVPTCHPHRQTQGVKQ
jgi:hypothetical protein